MAPRARLRPAGTSRRLKSRSRGAARKRCRIGPRGPAPIQLAESFSERPPKGFERRWFETDRRRTEVQRHDTAVLAEVDSNDRTRRQSQGGTARMPCQVALLDSSMRLDGARTQVRGPGFIDIESENRFQYGPRLNGLSTDFLPWTNSPPVHPRRRRRSWPPTTLADWPIAPYNAVSALARLSGIVIPERSALIHSWRAICPGSGSVTAVLPAGKMLQSRARAGLFGPEKGSRCPLPRDVVNARKTWGPGP
jgi:hypothetical protein